MLSETFKKLLMGQAFSIENGRIKLFGRTDWSVVPSNVVAELLQNIAKNRGEKHLFDFGYDCGVFLSRDVIKGNYLNTKDKIEIKNEFIKLLDFIGFGKIELIVKDKNALVIRTYKNPVIEHASSAFGNKSLVCKWFMGVYTAYGELFGIKSIRLREKKCICKGDPYCEWESG